MEPQRFPCPACPRALTLTPLGLAKFWCLGWRPGVEFRVVGVCGHGQDFTPWPAGEGRWRWVRILGEAA